MDFSLGDQLQGDYKDLDKNGQRVLIDRALDRQRLKTYIGSQLRQENMKVSQVNRESMRNK